MITINVAFSKPMSESLPQVTYICVSKLTIIESWPDNGVPHVVRHQAIIWARDTLQCFVFKTTIFIQENQFEYVVYEMAPIFVGFVILVMWTP